MGDHTETLQLDYDPAVISYDTLLTIFWENHNPTRPAWSRQYMSALFYHTPTQQRLAEATKAQQEAKHGRAIHTRLDWADSFYRAEDYHQKYSLRQTATLNREYSAIYPALPDFTDSTATTRVNGYLCGYGSLSMFEVEADEYGLSDEGVTVLRQMVQRFNR